MIAPKFSSICLLSLAACILLAPLSHGASLPRYNNVDFAKRASGACCSKPGLFCGNELPSDCDVAAGSLYFCTGLGAVPQRKLPPSTKRCPAVTCEWEIQASGFAGDIYGYDTRDKTKKRLIYASKDSGETYGVAVNSLGIDFKSSSARAFSGTEDSYWTPHDGLVPQGYGPVSAYGALPNNSFIFASFNGEGVAFTHTSEVTSVSQIKFIDQEDSAYPFCIEGYVCFDDIAIDGNGYAWIISPYGGLYISTESQFTVQGGPVMYIGNVRTDITVRGIAFDSLGHVYYGAANSQGTSILMANMTTPTETSIFIREETFILSDLASCAFPKVDIAHLLQ